jgi:hypothetical protein
MKVILLSSFMLGQLPALVAAPPVTAMPNIIFVFADDWSGGNLSCHGQPWLTTPHLDRLASEGIDSQQFNVLDSVCSPSCTAATTGPYPARPGEGAESTQQLHRGPGVGQRAGRHISHVLFGTARGEGARERRGEDREGGAFEMTRPSVKRALFYR